MISIMYDEPLKLNILLLPCSGGMKRPLARQWGREKVRQDAQSLTTSKPLLLGCVAMVTFLDNVAIVTMWLSAL